MTLQSIRIYVLMVAVLTATACKFQQNSPEEYFDQAALNTNDISRFGTYYFEGYQKYLKSTSGSGKVTSCEEYLKNSISRAETNLEKVKQLKQTTETRQMLEASITLYSYVLTSYKSEHLEIAKMIDMHEPEAQINQALTSLDNKPYNAFIDKYNKLWKLASKYAKDNKIEVEEMPF
ncbi:hypothetical protein OC25_10975 [Pedobacter kyungheensis]|uniref:DUF4142 domain-containing protein n=1 Tax=Pedobacter kyungheensis TaxID=1069985 RepID=A0A0C1FMF7_9SPHI|nr:hypothetical protein [Pedobacter kyungheensis]KIA94107.1 hypothetical protein OC25_10975 [Pedobacter kyungheensis]